MAILLASSNPHKLNEITTIWEDLGRAQQGLSIDLIPLNRIDPDGKIPEPLEDQPTFEANAVLKARYYASMLGMPTIADDSGLEVDALGGQPGVRSARYAGVSGPRHEVDQANNSRLMNELMGVEAARRTARFVCAMALCTAACNTEEPLHDRRRLASSRACDSVNGARLVAVVRGMIQGRIIDSDEQPRGDHGFGYDPLFYVPSLGKTTAQLDPAQKNAVSHRRKAAGLMWQHLQTCSW